MLYSFASLFNGELIIQQHKQFCADKAWDERVFPMAEVYYINEKDEVEIKDFDTYFRSKQGVISFLEEAEVLEPKYNPEAIFERTVSKFN